MGREVRMVPKDWKHPKENGRFVPLFYGSDYADRAESWLKSLAEKGLQETIEYDGRAPDKNDYMPVWTKDEATYYMMYENTSEGTPISPAFATPEELAQWLADNNASAFGNSGASYEGWLRVCKGGYACSAVMVNGQMMSGVDGLTKTGGGV